MKESKEKRAENKRRQDWKSQRYYGMERTKATTYSATHKPDYSGKRKAKEAEI